MSKKYYSESKKYQYLGEYIRDKRKDAHVSQQELAEALGISKRQIIRFEHGTPMNHLYVLKMMFILRITTLYSIFGQVEEMNEFNQVLGNNPTLVQKEIIDKTWSR